MRKSSGGIESLVAVRGRRALPQKINDYRNIVLPYRPSHMASMTSEERNHNRRKSWVAAWG